MKIKPASPKRFSPAPQPLQELIAKLESVDEKQIPDYTAQLNDWIYPRGDLFHWMAVLNRFDIILQRICTDYHLQHLQSREFESGTKVILLAVMQLSRVIFENSKNRSLYNSFEHMTTLLNTMDIDVLESVLHFMLFAAQRVKSPRVIQSTFHVPINKLSELARSWGTQTSLAAICDPNLMFLEDMRAVRLRFYRTPPKPDTEAGLNERELKCEEASMVIFQLSSEKGKSDMELMRELIKLHNIPEEYHYELATQVRIKKHLTSLEMRKKLLSIRLLATGIIEHAVSMSTIQNKWFLYEPQLMSYLADLVHSEAEIPYYIQEYALYAFAGFAQNRGKMAELLTALNLTASHGILMQIIRRITRGSEDTFPQSFLYAFFTFLLCLLQSQKGLQALISAGVIPALIELLGNQQCLHTKYISTVITLLDPIINGSSGSLSGFCNSGGVDTLVKRIKIEVERCIKHTDRDDSSDSAVLPSGDECNREPLTAAGTSILYGSVSGTKSILRLLLRMMDYSGTTDGLRNLVESSVLLSLLNVISHHKVFGSTALALAMNIVTTFIHSEPTCFPILNEAKLPQTLLDTMCAYDHSCDEVLVSALNAFEAICLNNAGVDMFNKTNPLPHFFNILSNQNYLCNTAEVDVIIGLGRALDDLIRHYPCLKAPVFIGIGEVLEKVIKFGNGESGDTGDHYRLKNLWKNGSAACTRGENGNHSSQGYDIQTEENLKCCVASYIDRVARFLEGFLQRQTNVREFMENGFQNILLEYYALPLLPPDFSVNAASDPLVYIFEMMTEVAAIPTIMIIANKIREASRFIPKDFPFHAKSILSPYIDVEEHETEKIEEGTRLFGQYIILHGYLGLLSSICKTVGLSPNNACSSLAEEFVSTDHHEESMIMLLGRLHRMILWEGLLLKEYTPKAWYSSKHLKKNIGSDHVNHSPGIIDVDHAFGRHITTDNSETDSNCQGIKSGDHPIKEDSLRPNNPWIQTLRNIKLVLSNIPEFFTPIFKGLVKVSVSIRGMDTARKDRTLKLAESMAQELKQSIVWPEATLNGMPYKYEYFSAMYSMISVLLLGDRPQALLNTPLVVAFDRQRGTDLLLQQLDITWEAVSISLTVPLECRTRMQQNTLSCAYNALETLLSSLQYIGSSKLLRDSPYTNSIVEKNTNSPCCFDPYKWIVNVQIKLAPIRQYLTSKYVYEVSETTVNLLLAITKGIYKGEGESSLKNTDDFRPHTIFPPNPSLFRSHNTRDQMPVAVGLARSTTERAMLSPSIFHRSTEVTSTSELYQESPMLTDSSEGGSSAKIALPRLSIPVTIAHGHGIRGKADFSDQIESLQAIRDAIETELPPCIVELVDIRDDVIFSVRDLLVAICKSKIDQTEAKRILSFLVDRISECHLQGLGDPVLSTRLRMLALLLKEESVQRFISDFIPRLAFIFDMVSSIGASEPDTPALPWLATALLVLESLISQDDEPRVVSLERPDIHNLGLAATRRDSAIERDSHAVPTEINGNRRSQLLLDCLKLLEKSSLSRNEVYAVLRLLVRLTKDHEAAKQLVNNDGLSVLFARPRSTISGLQGQQSFIVLVLRHIIESGTVLEKSMDDIITTWFTIPRPRNMDIKTFIRSNAHIALRNPTVFLKVSGKICRIIRYDKHNDNPLIKLYRKDPKGDETIQAETSKRSKEITTDHEEMANQSNATTTTIINYLLEELLEVCGERSVGAKREFMNSDEHSKVRGTSYVYTKFILQCLVELLTSYDACKFDIYTFCCRENYNDENTPCPQQSIMHILINDLLPFNQSSPDSEESRRQKGLSMWTSSVLVAMCYSGGPANEDKDLKKMRKYIFDGIVQSFKEAIESTVPLSEKYKKYIALAGICHRILNARSSNDLLSIQSKEDVTMAVGKLMIDQDIIGVLTAAIDSVDIEYPHFKDLLIYLLQPLEQLANLGSKITVKVKKLATTKNEVSSYESVGSDHEDGLPDPDNNFERNSQDDHTHTDELYEVERLDVHTAWKATETHDQDIGIAYQPVDIARRSSENERQEHTWRLEDIENDPIISSSRAANTLYPEVLDVQRYRNLTDMSIDDEHAYELDSLDQSDFEDNGSENLDDDDFEADFRPGRTILDDEQDDDQYHVGYSENSGHPNIWPAPRRVSHQIYFRFLPVISPALAQHIYGDYSRSVIQDEVVNHPLLSENCPAITDELPSSRAGSDNLPQSQHRPNGENRWQSLEYIVGGSPIRLLENNLMQASGAAQNRSLPVDARGRTGLLLRNFGFNNVPSRNGVLPNDDQTNGASHEAVIISREFQPMSTSDRWDQEVRMMYGTTVWEKSQRLFSPLFNTLSMIAIDEEKILREKMEKRRLEQRKVAEEKRREGEEKRRRHEEEERKKREEDLAKNADTPNEQQQQQQQEASSSEAPWDRRNVLIIRGEEIDISQTGLDIEFLQALPEDLQLEVIRDRMTEQDRVLQQPETDSISSEFLNALPAAIREEVLQQEAIERERRDRPQQLPYFTEDMPDGIAAMGHTTLEGRPAASEPFHFGTSQSGLRPTQPDDLQGAAYSHDRMLQKSAIQFVGRSQLAILARLLFVPQFASKSVLKKLLVNLCENRKSRIDLLSLIICALYDGSSNLMEVDRSFSRLLNPSKDANTTPLTKTAFAGLNSDFIAQRCLNFLIYVIQSNEQSLAYFMVENDNLSSLKLKNDRKGKGRESAPKFPLLILMSLLDRPVFMNNQCLMEGLMHLISTICRPFPALVKKHFEKMEKDKSVPKPPTISDDCLCQVVHVLTSGECLSNVFQYTTNTILRLISLDGAKETIICELVKEGQGPSKQTKEDLANLFSVLDNATPKAELQESILSHLSSRSSDQAKLLRILKTVDNVFSHKLVQDEHESNSMAEKEVLDIYDQLELLPLWTTLGQCLTMIHKKEHLINSVMVLLPLIESFMVVYKYRHDMWHESFFFTFTEEHKKVLNIIVRHNPGLMLGSFSLLVRNPKVLEFDNKRSHFVQQLRRRTALRTHYGSLELNVRRLYVFEDSYHQLLRRSGDDIKYSKLNVRFSNEDGVDGGGLTREWFSDLARQMFDPNYALFVTSAADKLTYQPNRASWVNPDHLSYFKFVGRVIGKAIYDGRLLDAYFTRSFYKHILSRTVDYRDVEAIDFEYYKSLVWMLENDITDIIDLTFSIETDDFGTSRVVDLKPDGRNIPVTNENKQEYVALITEQKLTNAIKEQIQAFLQGFHDIIPASLIQIFNEQELELLISGLPDIDIDDWKNNTEYQGGYTPTSIPIQWFWRVVRSFDQEERAKLLQFATGTSKVPLEGFAHLEGPGGPQKFQIHKDYRGENRLPSAHTCFNQIDLPAYDSYESLRGSLFKAINECSTGFGFA